MNNPRSKDFPAEFEPTEAKPTKMPRPTFWPVALAFGSVFTLWGLVTSLIISAVGLVIFGISLGGWILELRHE